MDFNLVQIFREMGALALAVVGVLTVMAMAAITVFIERLWVYWRSRRSSRRFGARAAELLDGRKHADLVEEAGRHGASHLARLLASGMRAYLRAVREPGELSPIELVRRDMERRAEALSAEVRRGLSVLASVGSVAPFVGLLGTVVGIIAAFQGIAKEGSGGLGAVSAGIAEALVVTALGLLVAIPAVLVFNYLNGKADALLLALEQSRGEFLDYLENQHAGAASGSAASRTQRPEAEGKPNGRAVDSSHATA